MKKSITIKDIHRGEQFLRQKFVNQKVNIAVVYFVKNMAQIH